jgi:hypothetical protein
MLPITHKVLMVAWFKTLNLEQPSHWAIHSLFEWSGFTAGKPLKTHWLAIMTQPVTEIWHMSAAKCNCGNGSCLLKILLSEARMKRLWVSCKADLPTSCLQHFMYLKYKNVTFQYKFGYRFWLRKMLITIKPYLKLLSLHIHQNRCQMSNYVYLRVSCLESNSELAGTGATVTNRYDVQGHVTSQFKFRECLLPLHS